MMIAPIHLYNIHLSLKGRKLLNGINLQFPFNLNANDKAEIKAGITVLMGANGAGKSLLMQIMAGLITPQIGKVSWANKPIIEHDRLKLGLLLQRPILFRRTVLENLIFVLKLSHASKAAHLKEMAMQALNAHGLVHLAEQYAPALSGGEAQRIAMLRAKLLMPEIFIFDEPTANLDPASTLAIEQDVKNIAANGIPCLFITHNIQQARRLADFIWFMDQGQLDPPLPVESFFANPASSKAQAFLDGFGN